MTEDLELVITIPADKKALVLECFTKNYLYQEQILDGNNQKIANPVTPEQFAKNQIAKIISDMVHQYEVHKTNIEQEPIIAIS